MHIEPTSPPSPVNLPPCLCIYPSQGGPPRASPYTLPVKHSNGGGGDDDKIKNKNDKRQTTRTLGSGWPPFPSIFCSTNGGGHFQATFQLCAHGYDERRHPTESRQARSGGAAPGEALPTRFCRNGKQAKFLHHHLGQASPSKVSIYC